MSNAELKRRAFSQGDIVRLLRWEQEMRAGTAPQASEHFAFVADFLEHSLRSPDGTAPEPTTSMLAADQLAVHRVCDEYGAGFVADIANALRDTAPERAWLEALAKRADQLDREELEGALHERLYQLDGATRPPDGMPGARAAEYHSPEYDAMPTSPGADGMPGEPDAARLRGLIARMRIGMKRWASDEDGIHEMAADAFNEASRLLGLPEITEDNDGRAAPPTVPGEPPPGTELEQHTSEPTLFRVKRKTDAFFVTAWGDRDDVLHRAWATHRHNQSPPARYAAPVERGTAPERALVSVRDALVYAKNELSRGHGFDLQSIIASVDEIIAVANAAPPTVPGEPPPGWRRLSSVEMCEDVGLRFVQVDREHDEIVVGVDYDQAGRESHDAPLSVVLALLDAPPTPPRAPVERDESPVDCFAPHDVVVDGGIEVRWQLGEELRTTWSDGDGLYMRRKQALAWRERMLRALNAQPPSTPSYAPVDRTEGASATGPVFTNRLPFGAPATPPDCTAPERAPDELRRRVESLAQRMQEEGEGDGAPTSAFERGQEHGLRYAAVLLRRLLAGEDIGYEPAVQSPDGMPGLPGWENLVDYDLDDPPHCGNCGGGPGTHHPDCPTGDPIEGHTPAPTSFGKVDLDGDLIPAMPPAKALRALSEHYAKCGPVEVRRCVRFGNLTHGLYLLWVYVGSDKPTCYVVFRDEHVEFNTESHPMTVSHLAHFVSNATPGEVHEISTRVPGSSGDKAGA